MDERDENEPREEVPQETPISERVRIIGAQPAGNARSPESGHTGASETGGVFSTGLFPPGTEEGDEAGTQSILSEPELPHWTEPPTGQVPAVLERRGPGDADATRSPFDTGPTWREQPHEWDDSAFEPLLADPNIRMGALDDTPVEERRPWEFGDDLASADEMSLTQQLSRSREDAEDDDRPGSAEQPNAIGEDFTERRGDRGEGSSSGGPAAGAGPGDGGGDQSWWDEIGADLGPPGEGNGYSGTGLQQRGSEVAHYGGSGWDDGGREPEGLEGDPRGGAQQGLMGEDEGPGGAGSSSLPAEPPTQRVTVGVSTRVASAVSTPAAATHSLRQDALADEVGIMDLGRTGRRGKRARGGTARNDAQHTSPTEPDSSNGRNVPIAAATGLLVAAVALLCFSAGTVATLALVTIIVTLTAAECFAAFRRSGRRPATLLGLVATAAVMVAAYAKGIAALPLVLAIFVVATMVWYLAGVERTKPLEGMSSTIFGFVWVGLLGSFAGLLLAPSQYPDRHGIAFLLGAVVAVVGADVGALAVGGWIGRRPLAPAISPNKTWEGAIGGAIVAVLASAFITGAVHPWTPSKAVVLGVVAAVLAPLGDLAESLVKRDLGLKDMGSILPGHGGLLDRFDGLLFVLPATYYLVRVLHLG